jgi:hypothetical protein
MMLADLQGPERAPGQEAELLHPYLRVWDTACSQVRVCGTNGAAGLRRQPGIFLVSGVCGVLCGSPAELWLVVQCLRQVVVGSRLKWVGPGQHVTKTGEVHLRRRGGMRAASRSAPDCRRPPLGRSTL